MRKLITDIPPAAVLTGMITDLNKATAALEPFKINLTNEEKSGSRSMGQNREGYVRMISAVATQFPNSLGRTDDPRDLVDILNYNSALKGVLMAVFQATETIQETLLGVGIDTMTLSDRFVDNLQISRKHDGSLDLAMEQIDEYNKRFGRRDNPEDDVELTVPNN